jgi:hypothetical protein
MAGTRAGHHLEADAAARQHKEFASRYFCSWFGRHLSALSGRAARACRILAICLLKGVRPGLFASSYELRVSLMLDIATGQKLIALKEKIVANFGAGDWEELGLLTGSSNLITQHERLLRSLSWNDSDSPGHVLSVLRQMVESDDSALTIIERYVDKQFPEETKFISARPAARKVTFAPIVFTVPELETEADLVAIMMPFSAEFKPVYEAISDACENAYMRCLRADDIWEEATIVQDIFNLIFRSQIVVVDFTGKNPNVMYETGIAHTLGKQVIPITQSMSDVHFDIQHHRALKYLSNTEGLQELRVSLARKLGQFRSGDSF